MKKICSECGTEKSFDEFPKRPKGKHGVGGVCKECKYAYTRKWLESRPEKAKEYGRQYYQRNAKALYEKRKERVSVWNAENPEKVKAYKAAYRDTHRAEISKPLKELTSPYMTTYLKRKGYPEGFINNPDLVKLKRAQIMLKRAITEREKQVQI